MNQAISDTDARELIDTLAQIQVDNYTCQITILNGTPSDWNVTIAAAGIKFFYHDGTDYTDGPRPINLGANATATFTSNKPKECVVGYFAALTVVVDGQSDTKTDSYTEEPNKCLLHTTIRLGPALTSIAQNDLGKPMDRNLAIAHL